MSASAQACSLRAGYLPPTNYELVRMVPTIVLARAVSTYAGNGTPNDPSTVGFEVQEVVKGKTAAANIQA